MILIIANIIDSHSNDPHETKNHRLVVLFLSFFEGNAFAELCAVFLELDLASNKLFVLARQIDFSSSFVAQLYEVIL